jgi:hypothetical protein
MSRAIIPNIHQTREIHRFHHHNRQGRPSGPFRSHSDPSNSHSFSGVSTSHRPLSHSLPSWSAGVYSCKVFVLFTSYILGVRSSVLYSIFVSHFEWLVCREYLTNCNRKDYQFYCSNSHFSALSSAEFWQRYNWREVAIVLRILMFYYILSIVVCKNLFHSSTNLPKIT